MSDGYDESGLKQSSQKKRRKEKKNGKNFFSSDSKDKKVEDNIGRRVYDALNV